MKSLYPIKKPKKIGKLLGKDIAYQVYKLFTKDELEIVANGSQSPCRFIGFYVNLYYANRRVKAKNVEEFCDVFKNIKVTEGKAFLENTTPEVFASRKEEFWKIFDSLFGDEVDKLSIKIKKTLRWVYREFKWFISLFIGNQNG